MQLVHDRLENLKPFYSPFYTKEHVYVKRIHSSLYYNPARYVTDELVETQPNQY